MTDQGCFFYLCLHFIFKLFYFSFSSGHWTGSCQNFGVLSLQYRSCIEYSDAMSSSSQHTRGDIIKHYLLLVGLNWPQGFTENVLIKPICYSFSFRKHSCSVHNSRIMYTIWPKYVDTWPSHLMVLLQTVPAKHIVYVYKCSEYDSFTNVKKTEKRNCRRFWSLTICNCARNHFYMAQHSYTTPSACIDHGQIKYPVQKAKWGEIYCRMHVINSQYLVLLLSIHCIYLVLLLINYRLNIYYINFFCQHQYQWCWSLKIS